MTESGIAGYWDDCDAVLALIRVERPDTVDAVVAILNESHPPSSGLAFFDSGGGDGLSAALGSAGWKIDPLERDYLWDARHPGTGEELRYVEGDVYRGRYRRPGSGRAGRGHPPQPDRGRDPGR